MCVWGGGGDYPGGIVLSPTEGPHTSNPPSPKGMVTSWFVCCCCCFFRWEGGGGGGEGGWRCDVFKFWSYIDFRRMKGFCKGILN